MSSLCSNLVMYYQIGYMVPTEVVIIIDLTASSSASMVIVVPGDA